ncbi:MAG: Fic family protein [Flavobacteriales bacterium]|jgi:Fic family protein|nr:Fic family protein [Flavobacteriales bacterium]
MLNLLTAVHHRLGEVHARHLHLPPADLERAYRVSSVHATVAIEGGALEPRPVAELVARPAGVDGPEALEVVNTHRVMEMLPGLDPYQVPDLRRAHAVLMHGLSMDAGRFRSGPMDVLYGDPGPLRTATAHNLPAVVGELLRHTEESGFPPLITSCVLHFGLIYLRPFTAGNGRLARLWQRRMLAARWPVFAYLPVEAFILHAAPAYHGALEYADRQGDCGEFITYMLERIDEALAELLAERDPVRGPGERVGVFLQQSGRSTFRRKDYLAHYPELSTATATRDLRDAVAAGRLVMDGAGRAARYRERG